MRIRYCIVSIGFKRDTKGSNVLWVPKLRRSVLLVLEIERNGYRVLFRYGHVFLVPRRTSFISTIVLGVREGKPI